MIKIENIYIDDKKYRIVEETSKSNSVVINKQTAFYNNKNSKTTNDFQEILKEEIGKIK